LVAGLAGVESEVEKMFLEMVEQTLWQHYRSLLVRHHPEAETVD
jgi:hypothetical protein